MFCFEGHEDEFTQLCERRMNEGQTRSCRSENDDPMMMFSFRKKISTEIKGSRMDEGKKMGDD
jgi:hypothetical protein